MTVHDLAAFAPFEAVCADFYRLARKAADRGERIAGFMCSYSPQELFHAAGYFPVRILGRAGNTPRADELLQAYACSFARSTLDSALAGEFHFLSLAVFSHTCDTMQNVADLWRRNRPETPAIIVSTPTLTEGPAARRYFRRELERVRARLEELAGPISDERIRESICLYTRHRKVMQRLYALRRAHPEQLSAQQMIAVILAAFLMRREDHLAHTEKLVTSLASLKKALGPPGARVLVAGSVCQNLAFIKVIEAAGCTVVDDDLCMGSRSFSMPEVEEGEPLDMLAQMYLGRTPCPAFHKPGFDPGRHILEKAREAKADGVIFLLTKFCDPWLFDHVHINRVLEDAGIPTLTLEIEQHLPPSGQMRTRAQAFAELLQARAG